MRGPFPLLIRETGQGVGAERIEKQTHTSVMKIQK